MLSVNADPEAALLRRRVAELEHALDALLRASDTSATLRQRELARARGEAALLARRTLPER